MKTDPSGFRRVFSALVLLLGASSPHCLDLQGASLGVNLYAGLTITGPVGAVYSIQCASELGSAEAGAAWRCLEYVRLPHSPYVWTDKSAPATSQRLYRALKVESPPGMVFIPPGTFRMGSPDTERDRFSFEGPQTQVTISRGFWIGKHEVTQASYEALMGGNPSRFVGGERPVDSVTWDEATEYCAKLTQREREAGRLAVNDRYRLPTEAEWEYACRALTAGRFSFEEDPGSSELADFGWYNANSGWETHPVGQKLPNPWGLHDVHGNVWEWCQDWLGAYAGGVVTDPSGPEAGASRVVRGGSWDVSSTRCRSAMRLGTAPDKRDDRIGFRVVLVPGEPPLVLERVLSRRDHGAAGNLGLMLPLASPYGVEPRVGGGHTLRFEFNVEVVGAQVAVHMGTATIQAVTVLDRGVTVSLTGAPDAQWITLRLTEIAAQSGETLGTVDFSFGVLEGDVDGDRLVSASDLAIVNDQVGREVGTENLRADFNCSGGISGADVLSVNRRIGAALPSAP